MPKRMLAICFCLAGFPLLNQCVSDPNAPLSAPDSADTSYVIHGVGFPDAAIFDRSVRVSGNNFRFSKFLAKCVSGAEVKVGFIGGSITSGAKSSSQSARYSTRLCTFLKQRFPGANFTEINAGIGATDSRFGVSRVNYDLLSHQPDLVVLEFAVNDNTGDTEKSARSMEGLVRKCLQKPDVPVLIFQTMNKLGDSTNHLIQGKIGAHYGIPVIDYLGAIWPLVVSGEIPWSSISPDDVHPNDSGHMICSQLLSAFLETKFRDVGVQVDSPAATPAPLYSDLYQAADMLHVGDGSLTVQCNWGWDVSTDADGRISLRSMSLGDTIAFQSTAKEITLQFQYAKDLHAKICVKINGVAVDTVSNFFGQDWGGGYLNAITIPYPMNGNRLLLENVSGGEFDVNYVLYAP